MSKSLYMLSPAVLYVPLWTPAQTSIVAWFGQLTVGLLTFHAGNLTLI